MRTTLAAGIVMSSLLIASPGHAQSNRCLGALVRDFREMSFNQATSYALIQLLNSDFSSSQRSQFGVTAPIHGVPISLNSSQARQIENDFSSQTGVHMDQATSIQMLSSTLSSNAVEAYRICVDGQQTSGPRVLAFDATPSHVTVQIRWIAPAGAPDSTRAHLHWSGGKPDSPLPHDLPWTNNQARSIIFDRTPGEALRVTADIGGGSDAVTAPYVPRIDVSEHTTVEKKGPYKLETDTWGHNEGPRNKCEEAPIGGEIDPSTARIKMDVWAGPLDSTTYARIDDQKTDTSRVCWTAFLRPLTAHRGGIIVWHVIYDVISFSFHVEKPLSAYSQ